MITSPLLNRFAKLLNVEFVMKKSEYIPEKKVASKYEALIWFRKTLDCLILRDAN